MNNNIKLSIIVPVYNVEKYLKQCIESIIDAYRDGIEVILVDDGSKDESDKICDFFSRKYDYIKVVHKKNGGLSSARNTGINLANGEFIWFIDSDDYIEKNSIDVIFDRIKKDTDMIFINYTKFYNNGKTEVYETFSESDNLNIKPYKYLNSLGNISYAAQQFIVKRKLIYDYNLFFSEGIYHEDEEWTPRVVCVAKTFTIIMPAIYNYRGGNPNSITGMLNPKKVTDKIFISKKMYNRIRKEEISDHMKEFIKSRIAHNYIAALNEYYMYDKNAKSMLLKELKKNIYLIDDIKSKKAIIVKIALKTIGVSKTSKLLNIRSKIKKDN